MGCVLVVMLIVFVPFGAYSYLVEPGYTGEKAFDILLLFLLVLQWIWVFGIVVHMYCGTGAPSAEVKAYRKQVLLFLIAFLLLTLQQAAFFIQNATGAYKNPNKADVYLNLFGQAFIDYIGVMNAVVWGITGSCFARLYLRVFGIQAGGLPAAAADLELPLLREPNSMFPSQRDSHSQITPAIGDTYSPPAGPAIRGSVGISADVNWQQGRDLLSERKWSDGADCLRHILNDKAMLTGLERGQEKRVAWALCYAIYMQAREALEVGTTPSAAPHISAVKLLRESLELIGVFEINFPGLIRNENGSDENCVVSFPVVVADKAVMKQRL
jgi:hypothetical protein